MNKVIYIPICNLEKLFSVSFFGDLSESLPVNKQEATIRTSESNAYGSIVETKSPIVILNFENKYKFCGLPIGVSILPKFAATVSTVTIHMSLSIFFDIFNAVIDGAWGVMLTGETAVGKYPVEAIRYLTKTAESAQVWVCKA